MLHEQYERTLQEAGLPTQRFHDLRHACATILISEGLNPNAVQEHLGHANVGITSAVYAHVLPEVREEAASRMDALFGG